MSRNGCLVPRETFTDARFLRTILRTPSTHHDVRAANERARKKGYRANWILWNRMVVLPCYHAIPRNRARRRR